MKKWKLVFVLSFLIILLPLIDVTSNSDIYNDYAIEIEENTPIFYLFSLNANDSVEIQLSRDKIGNISVFLFSNRPMNSYITVNQTLDEAIYKNSITNKTSQNPTLNYTAPQSKIFYLEILIFSNGSDILRIRSTRSLSRYYLPQISGFPFIIFSGTILFSVLVLIINKKRKIEISKS